MKIGILTFHCAHNYGAVLQAYALQTYLLKQGLDVKIINYRPEFLLGTNTLYDFRNFSSRTLMGKIKHIIGSPFIYRKKRSRYNAFESFIQHELNLSSIEDLGQLDLCIVGSDQVWNLNLTHGPDEFYGLLTDKIIAKRKISYAASLGNAEISKTNISNWQLYLSSFDEVSMREKESVELFIANFNKSITHVIDPVFLLDQQDWDILSKPIDDKYVLVYQVHFDQKVLHVASKIAEEKNCRIIQLTSRVLLSRNINLFDTAGINEFISLFKNAQYIVTTSFHGTAFAIINQKNFYTIKLGNSVDSRSMNLLASLGLENRAVMKTEQILIDDIDYVLPNEKLQTLKEHSRKYLLSNTN
ncbi:polysaccharide pyruvyl transferase [Orbus hercynius]|uniref:Polysaccharide pyruvyl transferase n=1 Tax=Orbus hercynius TaxID=593135 RepID=A0A495RB38_9GAMM|nr:polysaccharide pyruvyl transferase family protein [Orbus hercynius]RKS84693.1 polysaccharide pyruvyl transferase [Orbus hercynius]